MRLAQQIPPRWGDWETVTRIGAGWATSTQVAGGTALSAVALVPNQELRAMLEVPYDERWQVQRAQMLVGTGQHIDLEDANPHRSPQFPFAPLTAVVANLYVGPYWAPRFGLADFDGGPNETLDPNQVPQLESGSNIGLLIVSGQGTSWVGDPNDSTGFHTGTWPNSENGAGVSWPVQLRLQVLRQKQRA